MHHKLKNKLETYGHTINNQLWDEVQAQSKMINIKKNDILIDFGSRRKSVFFILTGAFVTSMITLDGDKKGIWFHLDELFPIAICGDSYFLDETTKYEIRALEDSVVIKLNKRDIELWILKYPMFNQFYITDVISELMVINEIRSFTLTHSPEQIFSYVNENYPAIVSRVSSKNMAHFLGISPEWYSKLKKRI